MQARELAGELRDVVEAAVAQLRHLSEAAMHAPRAPGKWSGKQVLGHLIDSASNNHGRFVRATLADSMVFAGYDQDGWVVAQRYQDTAWPKLVELWASFNLHLVHTIAGISDEVLMRRRAAHNLHEVAFEGCPAEEPVTLRFFIRDYVNHMRHHLRQIDEGLAEMPTIQIGRCRWRSK